MPWVDLFARVGFAADKVDESIGKTTFTAHDAEATALVASAEFLLGKDDLNNIEVHLHYDARAVGDGAHGSTKLIEQDPRESTRQHAARILLHLVQCKAKRFNNLHVHAHCGHPWNEFVDSVAVLTRKGWTPSKKSQSQPFGT